MVPSLALPERPYLPHRRSMVTRQDQRALHTTGELLPELDPIRWSDSVEYLFGFDLFNHGFYWEAHESWETVWIALGRRGLSADFVKGLIKLAAAGVKSREGRTEGVNRHARKAREIFSGIRDSSPTHMGLDLDLLLNLSEEIATSTGQLVESETVDDASPLWDLVLVPNVDD